MKKVCAWLLAFVMVAGMTMPVEAKEPGEGYNPTEYTAPQQETDLLTNPEDESAENAEVKSEEADLEETEPAEAEPVEVPETEPVEVSEAEPAEVSETEPAEIPEEDADKAARTVANSPLVKTAIFGHDANWGRIAGALGRSGALFKQEDVSIDIMGIPVCRNGLTVEFSEEEALRRFELPEIVLEANLGAGTAEATIWTCDFSHEYVTINGDYRS